MTLHRIGPDKKRDHPVWYRLGYVAAVLLVAVAALASVALVAIVVGLLLRLLRWAWA